MTDAPQGRGRRHGGGRAARVRPRGWCCSFAGAPQSPDLRPLPSATAVASPGGGGGGGGGWGRKLPPKSPSAPSFHGSPTSSRLAGLGGLIDPRRILSPGRVSPIDLDGSVPPPLPLPLPLPPPLPPAEEAADVFPTEQSSAVALLVAVREEGDVSGSLDLRLFLRGRDGRCVLMELDSRVLCCSSAFFAAMAPAEGAVAGDGSGGKRIEVDGVDNVEVFRAAVELMYEPDPMRWLAATGVSRAIDVLEVCSSIMFDRGIKLCLTYIEAVPWSENEEEKLKSLFARCTFDEVISQDILARLRPHSWNSSEDLTVQLIQSVTSSINSGARKDMQSLVNGLLSKSSVYQKDLSGLNKESLYQICYSCLESLVDLFEEAIESTDDKSQAVVVRGSKPLIERVSSQTENLNWLLDILVNNDMAEEFVELWAKQDRLIRMHEQVSPMIRYELSRISSGVFVALGKGRVQCRGDVRSLLFHGWFSTMLLDFGWLQRCSKGLDLRSLEENLGRGLLTLPLRQQQCLFEEWFQFYVSRGAECPNLIRAFQVWWRRSFVR
ncbi:BTB/POZ domain-containing protein At2g13690-like [Phragmites australis]|uniref:BTB/POZ domain-containing protein At2g13690-like n=1 Tax=Phragmites australis TaxID=29695 RepID=UPI002D78F3BA|nr:BTB/POZ domain-containing protein At2g13690-like [Phragmites australis]